MRPGMLVFALLLAGSCRGGASPAQGKDMPQPAVRFETPRGPWVVRVEVARTNPTRARGLMFRRELPSDHGMLFVFDETSNHAMWMHNTLIPLDLIYLSDDRRVVGVVANAEPRTDTPRGVDKPSRYVVEVGGGEAGAHGVAPGARAVFLGVDE
jgi:uncharacterized membrane protein (UPF0127 family)